MRAIVTMSLLIFCAGCSKTTPTETSKLDGSWTPIHQEIGGNDVPADIFQTQRLLITDSLYTFSADSDDKGTLTYGEGRMDIYGKTGINAGKHITAIYKVDDGVLSICYNLLGDGYPASFETKSAPTLFLSVFKKN